MAKAFLVLHTEIIREKARKWITLARQDSRITFEGPKRTLPQNARMWAHLTDIAEQLTWHGVKLETEDWKLVFMDSLNREMRIVPNLDGTGFVNLGRSSSKLSIQEMGDLMHIIEAFGAAHGVVFHEPDPDTPKRPRKKRTKP